MNTTAGMQTTPVLTIDGPTASGKGTIAALVAERLGWNYLDSGALYRLAALGVEREAGRLVSPIEIDDEQQVASVAAAMRPRFLAGRIWLFDADVTDAIRQEHIGSLASRIAVYPSVRLALLQVQRAFRNAPGLVADGRDMGTVVFPDADLKIYLTASAEARASRRYRQLIAKGFSASLDSLLLALRERDKRDTTRAVAPLAPATDAMVIDSTDLDVGQTVERVLAVWLSKTGAQGLPAV